MRNQEYQKNLQKIIETTKKEYPKFCVGGSCVGEICLINDCGKDATHKVGEEITDEDSNPTRSNFVNYVCCEHYQMIFGEFAKSQCDEQNHKLYYEKIALISGK